MSSNHQIEFRDMLGEEYRGVSGYHLMLMELRTSVLDQIPEARDSFGRSNIYIFNQLHDQEEELLRAEKQLGVDDLHRLVAEQRPDSEVPFPYFDGQALHLTRPDGTTFTFITGVSPKVATRDWLLKTNPSPTEEDLKNAMEERLTPELIKFTGENNIHEIAHAIHYLLYPDEVPQKNIPRMQADANHIANETIAELFREDIIARNGGAKSSLYFRAAHYDLRKWKGGLDPYDSGEELLILAEKYYDNSTDNTGAFESFNIYGIRDSLIRSREITLEVQGHDVSPFIGYMFRESLRNVVKEMREADMSDEEIRNWVIRAKSFVYEGAQVEAAYNYLTKQEPKGIYKGAKPIPRTLAEAAGNALIFAVGKNDTFALSAAVDFLYFAVENSSIGMDAMYPIVGHIDTSKPNSEHNKSYISGWAEMLSDGKSLDEVFPDMQLALAKAMASRELDILTEPGFELDSLREPPDREHEGGAVKPILPKKPSSNIGHIH